jgi:hypothetical protein
VSACLLCVLMKRLHQGQILYPLTIHYNKVGRSSGREVEGPALSARTVGRGFVGCLALVSVCCVVLCRFRPCGELAARPRRPTACRTVIKKQLG